MASDPPGESPGEPVGLLLLWAEAVADLACLPPRRRAQVLARIAEEVRAAGLVYPWEMRPVNQSCSGEVMSPRRWRFAPEPGRVRVIGE